MMKRPGPPWGEADSFSLLVKDPAASREADQEQSNHIHSSLPGKCFAELCKQGKPAGLMRESSHTALPTCRGNSL